MLIVFSLISCALRFGLNNCSESCLLGRGYTSLYSVVSKYDMCVHEGAGLGFTLTEAAQNQPVLDQPADLLMSLSLSLAKSKGNQTWCKAGEEGEEKHFKGAQELKCQVLSAFLPSTEGQRGDRGRKSAGFNGRQKKFLMGSPMAQCCCLGAVSGLHCCLVLRDNLCIIL